MLHRDGGRRAGRVGRRVADLRPRHRRHPGGHARLRHHRLDPGDDPAIRVRPPLTGGARGMGGLNFPYDIGYPEGQRDCCGSASCIVVVARHPVLRRPGCTGCPTGGCSSPSAATNRWPAAWEIDVPQQVVAVRRRLGRHGPARRPVRDDGALPHPSASSGIDITLAAMVGWCWEALSESGERSSACSSPWGSSTS